MNYDAIFEIKKKIPAYIVTSNLSGKSRLKEKSDAEAGVPGGDVPCSRRLFEETNSCGGPGNPPRQYSHDGRQESACDRAGRAGR